MKYFIAFALILFSLCAVAQTKPKDSKDTTTHHTVTWTWNEDQIANLYQGIQVAMEKLPESDVISARSANRVASFLDSLATVLIKQNLVWHPLPPPPVKDTTTKKAP